MKILNSLSNLIWLFILIGAILIKVFIFPSEHTPLETSNSGNARFIYDLVGYAISLISVCVLGYLSSKVYQWLSKRKKTK